jgi:cephalosporin hydroxylase
MDSSTFNKLFNGDVFTEQNKDELMDTISLAESLSPKVVVEIGVKNGGTLNFWRSLSPKPELVIGIDSGDAIKWDVKTDQSVKFILGNSLDYSTYCEFLSVLGSREIDFLFIDGGHVYHEAKSDFYTFGWHVRSGGMIAIHDTHLDSVGSQIGSVKHFWEEVKTRSGKKWNVVLDKHIGTGIGIIQLT